MPARHAQHVIDVLLCQHELKGTIIAKDHEEGNTRSRIEQPLLHDISKKGRNKRTHNITTGKMGAPTIASEYGLSFQKAAAPICVHEKSTMASTPTNNDLDECDACHYCADTCNNIESCIPCQKKRIAMNKRRQDPADRGWFIGALSSICPSNNDGEQSHRTYTRCQLRRHNHAESAYILVGETIYDATPYIRNHPGGMEAILKKSGGAVDCTVDLSMHSKRAQKEWRKFKVGTLCRCRCPH